jgi:hypothetical protein
MRHGYAGDFEVAFQRLKRLDTLRTPLQGGNGP